MLQSQLRIGVSLLSMISMLSNLHGLTLGGAAVPKEKIVVYLMVGHSNMAGMDYRSSDGVANPKAYNYLWGTTKTWVAAKETPGAMKNGLSGNGSGGPSMPFLKGMVAAYPDYYFGVVTNASLSATCHGENTGNNGSDLENLENRYWKGTQLYNEIAAAAKQIQSEVTLGGIVCMLGTVEATRTPESVCKAFSADLAQFATDLRTDLNSPNLPFIMGEYETGATGEFAPTLPLPAIIASEIKLLPTKLKTSATIDSKGIEMFDNHHYTADVGEPEFAKRIIATIQAKSWFPPPASSILVNPSNRKISPAKTQMVFLPADGIKVVSDKEGFYLIDGKGLPAFGSAAFAKSP